jgi:type VI secretion system secreted protein VgrG
MNPLELFGRHRNLAITSKAIPSIMEGIQSLEVVRIEGTESMEGDIGFEYKVLLKTPAELSVIPPEVLLQSFDLAAFIGKEATLHIALDDIRVAGMNNTREITGIVASAQFKRAAERALHFEITLRDWLWLGTLDKNYAVFQNQSPVETIKATLNATFPYMFDIRLSNSYPTRDYCTRMGESATRFIKRLCAEYGINLHFEHRNGSARLILSDSNSAFTPFPSPAYQAIRYHADTDFIDEEHWHTFSPSRNLTTGAVTYRDHSYVAPDATNEVSHNEPKRNRANEAVNHGNAEQYHFHTNAFTNLVQPRAGVEEANDAIAEGKVFALEHLQSLQQHDDRSTAAGNIRAAVVGHTFALTNHPVLSANIDYIVVEAKLLVEEVASETQRITDAQEWRVETQVKLQPLNIPLKPNRILKKPRIDGVEIARVVGHNNADQAANNAIWTDDLGRIKVAFPWNRNDPHNHNSSCWVRVASNDAGNQQGGMHIPRINDEVLISYIGGDPDLPICTGRVYNSTHMPPWTLPDNQALSGYRSRELKPGNQADGRSNHILLDDSADAIQAQIKSDESHSSLSLGHITRVEDNAGRKDKRGTGLELRTDAHGAIRAAQGLLITTQGRGAAASHITDLNEAHGELKQGHNQHKNTGQMAVEHKAFDETDDAKELDTSLKSQNASIKSDEAANPAKGEFPELKKPHIVIHSPAGIETSTPQSTHMHSGEHIAMTAGQHLSLSIGKRFLTSAMSGIRMFAHSMGIKVFAARGKVEIQAQSGDLDIIADQVLKFISANRTIEIAAAEEILLTAKGSYIKINGKGIEHGTPAAWTVYSATKTLTGPRSLPFDYPNMPKHFSHRLDVYDVFAGGEFASMKYVAKFEDGGIQEGALDKHGRTGHITSNKKQKVKVLVGGNQWVCLPKISATPVSGAIKAKIIDYLQEPVKDIKYKVMAGESVIVSGVTGGNGEITLTPAASVATTIMVEGFISKEYGEIVSINPNSNIESLTLITPKILHEIELQSESDPGEYLRGTYQVKAGDTTSSIAEKFGMNESEVLSYNAIEANKASHVFDEGEFIKVKPAQSRTLS